MLKLNFKKKSEDKEGVRQEFCASLTVPQTDSVAGNQHICHPVPQVYGILGDLVDLCHAGYFCLHVFSKVT